MTVVAAAVIGSAVVGAGVAIYTGDKASSAAKKGSARAADATVQSTQMQVDEIKRQFDYQQEILLPQIQQQYNAQRAYMDLMGISGPQIGQNQETGYFAEARPASVQAERRQAEIATYQQAMDQLPDNSPDRQQYQDAIDEVNSRMTDQEQIDASNLARGAQMGQEGSSGVDQFRAEDGSFWDPNLDPTRLADDSAYGDAVRGNLLAPDDIADDDYNNYLQDNRMAADGVENDLMVGRTDDVRIADGAAGTGVYGDEFEASPGYSFAVEEMDRALDRKGSAGGPNIGGRAIMEAQRRAKGLADQEYYNWASGRERDLGRLGDAEAADIGRGDQAYAGYERQRLADVSRDDQGYQDYLRRLETDAARLDEVGSQEDRLRASDLARSDQGYYNYLDSLAGVAQYGGGSAATAVNASQAAGAATAGAYGSQGRQLSDNYSNLGVSQANIAYNTGAGVNNAVQGGVENWIAAGL